MMDWRALNNVSVVNKHMAYLFFLSLKQVCQIEISKFYDKIVTRHKIRDFNIYYDRSHVIKVKYKVSMCRDEFWWDIFKTC